MQCLNTLQSFAFPVPLSFLFFPLPHQPVSNIDVFPHLQDTAQNMAVLLYVPEQQLTLIKINTSKHNCLQKWGFRFANAGWRIAHAWWNKMELTAVSYYPLLQYQTPSGFWRYATAERWFWKNNCFVIELLFSTEDSSCNVSGSFIDSGPYFLNKFNLIIRQIL